MNKPHCIGRLGDSIYQKGKYGDFPFVIFRFRYDRTTSLERLFVRHKAAHEGEWGVLRRYVYPRSDQSREVLSS